eukprot:GILK01007259.1.p1 GENE.GILK01007259.1~~GILK01007259.1.p1  ORF type:complete len:729 (+),score=73.97 GILK01007259.1:176-2362(+)
MQSAKSPVADLSNQPSQVELTPLINDTLEGFLGVEGFIGASISSMNSRRTQPSFHSQSGGIEDDYVQAHGTPSFSRLDSSWSTVDGRSFGEVPHATEHLRHSHRPSPDPEQFDHPLHTSEHYTTPLSFSDETIRVASSSPSRPDIHSNNARKHEERSQSSKMSAASATSSASSSRHGSPFTRTSPEVSGVQETLRRWRVNLGSAISDIGSKFSSVLSTGNVQLTSTSAPLCMLGVWYYPDRQTSSSSKEDMVPGSIVTGRQLFDGSVISADLEQHLASTKSPPSHRRPSLSRSLSDGETGSAQNPIVPTRVRNIEAAFFSDFFSILWFTYRKRFEPLKSISASQVESSSGLTTDAGWGCMIRTGQMILAQALKRHFLGRDWRFPAGCDVPNDPKYSHILNWFLDSPAATSVYSIHKVTSVGQVKHQIRPGDWYGPTTVAFTLQELVRGHHIDSFDMLVATEGVVYRDQVKQICERECTGNGRTGWKSLFVLFPLRVGVERMNVRYTKPLLNMLSMPQSLGFIGGKPRFSLYFVGFQGEDVIYLDPHYVQPATHSIQEVLSSTSKSYHCNKPRRMSLSKIDPSLAIGFYIRDESDFEDFARRLAMLASSHDALLSVQDTMPNYESHPGLEEGFESINIEDTFDTPDDSDSEGDGTAVAVHAERFTKEQVLGKSGEFDTSPSDSPTASWLDASHSVSPSVATLEVRAQVLADETGVRQRQHHQGSEFVIL